ncbi:hypothetical protein E6C76_20135 [Pseudothauera nasutitermitis]|uniref:Uncharacterized protein n=1 Tax=Pseudothauera nasutitermitis TaxID=2565930 RepID=A0A4S4ASA9_9RHOO|nr:hypothetical protein [Pseudothauera nasutitermitis]THF61394.1 hypothetical protein E6C76_20135 [Pseudothauera nasutitermitis]
MSAQAPGASASVSSGPIYTPSHVDEISLKLLSAAAIIDLIYTLEISGGIDSLCEQSLATSLGQALDQIVESRELLLDIETKGIAGAAIMSVAKEARHER